MKKSILTTICCLGIVLCCNGQLSIGQEAPEIKLPDSLGKWSLLSSIQAEYVVVDFWAAWCPPCIVAIQELKKIKEKYAAHSFEVYAVSLDRDYHKWVSMERKMKLPFIHVNDAYGLRSPRCKAYGVESIPSKFLLKNGKILFINPSFDQIETELRNAFESN